MTRIAKEPDDGLNYHHLRYFWLVVREGSVVAAARKLHVSQPAVSGQVGQLERSLGQPLFERRGRQMKLTEHGRLIFGYADRIFVAGQEMVRAARQQHRASQNRLIIGTAESLSSIVTERVLEMLSGPSHPHHFLCHTGKHAELLTNLTDGKLDVAISDSPFAVPDGAQVARRQVGESDVVLLAGRELAARIGTDFPTCLNGAPMFLPTPDQAMRRCLDRWLVARSIHPEVVGEIGSADLLVRLAAPRAVFPAHALCVSAVAALYDLVPLGCLGVQLPIHAAFANNAARLAP